MPENRSIDFFGWLEEDRRIADPVQNYKEVISAANKIEDKEKRIDEKFRILHEITRLQDRVNLDIRSEVDDSEDPRWFPIHIIDDANAMILEISEYGGRPTFLCREGSYFRTKEKNLEEKVWEFVRYECKKHNVKKICDGVTECIKEGDSHGQDR